MESLQPEIQKALEDMNWEDRLKKARAKREAVLKARAAGDESEKREDPEKPLVTSIDMVERMRFGTVGGADQPAQKHRVAGGPGRMRLFYIGLGFVAGISAGVAIAALGTSFIGPQRTVAEQDLTRSPEGQTEADALAAADPQPTEQRAAGSGAMPRLPDEPTVMAEFTAEILPQVVFVAQNVPGMVGRPPSSPHNIDALGAPHIDRLPAIEAVPKPPQVRIADPELVNAPLLASDYRSPILPGDEFLDTELRNLRLVAGSWSVGAAVGTEGQAPVEQRLPSIAASPSSGPGFAIAEPVRPKLLASLSDVPRVDPIEEANGGPGIAVASFRDSQFAETESDLLARAPAADAAPPVDRVPPKPMIVGAEDMALWIFAAASADEDTIATAQTILEDYGLPLRAVTRVGYRISDNQVRFYDATTAAAAERLAKDIGAVARDFTGSNADPSPGTLEIYLAGEPTETELPRPVARPVETAQRPEQRSAPERLLEGLLSMLRGRFEP